MFNCKCTHTLRAAVLLVCVLRQISISATPITGTTSDSVAKQSDTADIQELEAVVVRAGSAKRKMQAAHSLTLVDPDEWAGTHKNVADVLAEQTGVQTRRYGGVGSYQTVSIRGIRGSEVLVLLDGIPLNSAMGGAVDLGKVNVSRLGEIEVYKGFVPSRFGGNSIGGAINLKSRSSNKGGTADVSVSYGGYDTQDHWISATHSTENRRVLGLLSYTHSANDFTYLDRNNTYYGTVKDPTRDDTVRTMQNSQYTGVNLYLHPVWYLRGERSLVSGLSLSRFVSHLPAPEGKINRTAYYSENTVGFDTKLVHENPDRLFAFDPGMAYRYREGFSFSSSLDESSRGPHGTFSRPNSYSENGFVQHSLSVPLAFKAVISKNIAVEPHLDFHFQDMAPTVNTTSEVHGDWHGTEVSCIAAADVSVGYHPFDFILGGSLEGIYARTEGGYHEIINQTVPPSDTLYPIASVNGALSYKPSDTYLLFLNLGRFSNQPSLRERYGARGAHVPNPDLLPEKGVATEFGAKLFLSQWFAEAAAFYNRTENTILTLHHGTLTKSVNCEGARVYGLELSMSGTLLEWLGLDSRATLQRTENLTRRNNYYGKRLPDEPDIALFQAVSLGPIAGLSLVYSADVTSFYYHDPANVSLRVPRKHADGTGDYWRVFHNAKLTWKPGKHLSASFSLSKFTNEYLTQQEAVTTDEDTYSLIRYPTNLWCVSMMYSF